MGKSVNRDFSDELFIQRPGGVLLHGFMDEAGELSFSLQAPTRDAVDVAAIEDYGLIVASSSPDGVVLDDTRHPPALQVGDACFILDESQVAQVQAFLHLHRVGVPHGRLS